MSLSNLQIINKLGSGSFGSVWLGKIGSTGEEKLIVMKKISIHNMSTSEKEKVNEEVKILASLKHPNIVSYKGSLLQSSYLCILMGYCEGGDLHTLLKNQNGHLFSEQKIIRLFIQIVMALLYLHQRNILHRDLKTRNIFITKSSLVKVGDFGISRKLESSEDMAKTIVGTPLYMSPEILGGIPYNQQADIWSLGCCLYEMLTLKHAFQAKDMCSLIFRITNGKIGKVPDCYSDELCYLVHRLLHNKPEERPSAAAILKMSFTRKHMEAFLFDTKEIERRKYRQISIENESDFQYPCFDLVESPSLNTCPLKNDSAFSTNLISDRIPKIAPAALSEDVTKNETFQNVDVEFENDISLSLLSKARLRRRKLKSYTVSELGLDESSYGSESSSSSLGLQDKGFENKNCDFNCLRHYIPSTSSVVRDLENKVKTSSPFGQSADLFTSDCSSLPNVDLKRFF